MRNIFSSVPRISREISTRGITYRYLIILFPHKNFSTGFVKSIAAGSWLTQRFHLTDYSRQTRLIIMLRGIILDLHRRACVACDDGVPVCTRFQLTGFLLEDRLKRMRKMSSSFYVATYFLLSLKPRNLFSFSIR